MLSCAEMLQQNEHLTAVWAQTLEMKRGVLFFSPQLYCCATPVNFKSVSAASH